MKKKDKMKKKEKRKKKEKIKKKIKWADKNSNNIIYNDYSVIITLL